MKIPLEKIIVAVMVCLLLWTGIAGYWGHRISHDYPYSYLASDTFQHQTRAEALSDIGNYRHEAFYITKGFDDIIGFYPPLIPHIGVLFSNIAGLEVYDAIYLFIFLFTVFSVLMMYLIIKQFSRHVAIISLPITILIYISPFVVGLTWGHWPAIASQFFLLAMVFLISKIRMKHSFILFAMIFLGMVLTHTSEAFFALFFLMIYAGVLFLIKKRDMSCVKNAGYGILIALAACSYYLFIFRNTWMKAQPYSFHVESRWLGGIAPYIIDFKFLLILMALGIVFSVLSIKKSHLPLTLSACMLLFGFGNYAGFGVRAFQQRFLWPVYLSFLFGLGIYYGLRLIIKKWNIYYSAALFIILVLIFLNILPLGISPHYTALPENGVTGIMREQNWQAIDWIKENTPEDARIFFFYGDVYEQDASVRNTKRLHYVVGVNDFAADAQAGIVKRHYMAELPGDRGSGFPYKKSAFSFGYKIKEYNISYFYGLHDVCSFDYIVFDKLNARLPMLAEYNLMIANAMLNSNKTVVVYQNQLTVILKNNNVGDDCIGAA